MNLINIALMLTGHVIQRTYREAVFDGAVENDNAATRGLVLSLAHRLACHGNRLLDCHPLGGMVSPHAGVMSDTPYLPGLSGSDTLSRLTSTSRDCLSISSRSWVGYDSVVYMTHLSYWLFSPQSRSCLTDCTLVLDSTSLQSS